MPVDKLTLPYDPRIQLRSAYLNGLSYGYLYANPSTPPKGTVILIHGFPDISFGWRYQVPYLLSLGLTVIAPDCPGYGRTDSPPYTINSYTYKRVADDIAELARQLHLSTIILGGHDWGGAIVYRIAQYYPSLVTHVFSICTPYFPPNPKYDPLHLLVSTRLPNFRYQEHFASGEIETVCQSKNEIKAFLNGLFGGKSPNGEEVFNSEKPLDLELLSKLKPTRLLGAEELEFYASEYARHGLQGPLNWYRNREANWRDEWQEWYGSGKYVDGSRVPKIEQEVLFVLARNDTALQEHMAAKMGGRIPNLTTAAVDAGHWAMWQKPEEINTILGKWFKEKVFKEGRSKL